MAFHPQTVSRLLRTGQNRKFRRRLFEGSWTSGLFSRGDRLCCSLLIEIVRTRCASRVKEKEGFVLRFRLLFSISAQSEHEKHYGERPTGRPPLGRHGQHVEG